ncbi:MAG: sigma 54-interacting transcriptional regulator [Myxococcales bacterium]|nr:sigma 54-interacting transcriptional regulator [Myxococcales bacterium]
MRRVLALAERVAASDATVLVTGESGTGKELLARFIHARSSRARKPFQAINCGALSETLLESELFGHVQGAFTGAVRDHAGFFAAAHRGTLFLDEVAETSSAVQVKLLRALQEHTVRPVGATRDVAVDVRLIAATNRDLAAMVAERTFRKDLYFRLRVVALEIPPLRDRRDDILPLARAFIARSCRENQCGPCALGAEALDLFMAHDWPGNVRELENAIERAVVLAEGKPRIEAADLPPEIRQPAPRAHDADDGQVTTLAELERGHILATLARLDGDRPATARALGISDNTLWRRLKQYGLVEPRRSRRRTR